jgi:hypothetical protein
MSDIVKCEGEGCPIREKCYRYTANDSKYQYYFKNSPFKYDFCGKFISAEEEEDEDIKKIVSWRT